jgi:hypothetical protein
VSAPQRPPRSAASSSFEASALHASHLLLSHEDEIQLGEHFRTARWDLCAVLLRSQVGARELARLAERLQAGELHLAALTDVDSALADPGAAGATGPTRRDACERRFLARIREVVRLHAPRTGAASEPDGLDQRRCKRLRWLASTLHLRDDVLCELAQRVMEGYPKDHDAYRAIDDAQRRGTSARDELVRCNVRFVITLARRYVGKGLSLNDLVQEGYLGLMRAVEKFDPGRGYRFSTYAAWWIRQGMSRALCNQSRTIRIPVHAIELNRQLAHARRRPRWRKGRVSTRAR